MIFSNAFSSAVDHPSGAPGEDPIEAEVPETRRKRILRISGWVAYGLFCLIVFTLMKLPEERLKAYIDSQISAQLAPRGITYSSAESDLSVIFGLKYTLKGVVLHFPPPSNLSTRIDQVQISPSLFSLLTGSLGGSLYLDQGEGRLSSSFSFRNSQMSVTFKAQKLDAGKLGLLPLLANLQGSALINAKGSISGDSRIPSTLDGEVSIQLSRIVIDQQVLMGFTIPRVSVSEANAEVEIDKAKAVIKTFRLGKPGNASDDIQGTVTGDITLAKNWETSNLNLKTRFSLSEGIMKSFMLLDAILGAGKQPDSSYAFNITGPVMSPFPSPLMPGQ